MFFPPSLGFCSCVALHGTNSRVTHTHKPLGVKPSSCLAAPPSCLAAPSCLEPFGVPLSSVVPRRAAAAPAPPRGAPRSGAALPHLPPLFLASSLHLLGALLMPRRGTLKHIKRCEWCHERLGHSDYGLRETCWEAHQV